MLNSLPHCAGDHTFLERPTLATSLADYITNLLEIVMSPLSAQESDVDYFCNVSASSPHSFPLWVRDLCVPFKSHFSAPSFFSAGFARNN